MCNNNTVFAWCWDEAHSLVSFNCCLGIKSGSSVDSEKKDEKIKIMVVKGVFLKRKNAELLDVLLKAIFFLHVFLISSIHAHLTRLKQSLILLDNPVMEMLWIFIFFVSLKTAWVQSSHASAAISSCFFHQKSRNVIHWKKQQVASDTSTGSTGLRSRTKSKPGRYDSAKRCSQPAYGETDRLRQAEGAAWSQTQRGRSAHKAGREAGWLRTHLDFRLVRRTSLTETPQGADGGGARAEHYSFSWGKFCWLRYGLIPVTKYTAYVLRGLAEKQSTIQVLRLDDDRKN